MRKAIAATTLALLAYSGLALLISANQAPLFMYGFLTGLFAITGVYSAILLSPHRPNRRRVAIGVSGVVTMLVGYLVMWFYWGSGDGPFSPYNGLFGSRITLYCFPPPNYGCFQINSWLIFAAFIIASLMILWELRPRGNPAVMARYLTPRRIRGMARQPNRTHGSQG